MRIWIDLDNSPHVPLFVPLIRHLREEGDEVFVTARDFAQTLDLVRQYKLDAFHVGKHAGKKKIRKVLNLPVRTRQLVNAVKGFQPEIALSHGSRTQVLAARSLGIPSIVMFDYEWTEMSIFKKFATHLVCPEAITEKHLGDAAIPVNKVSWYKGFKEDLYLPEFVPDRTFRASLGVEEDQRLVTVRPPGLIGNYHDGRSEAICRKLLRVASADPANFLVVLPKTKLEQELVRSALPENPAATVLIPEQALPGLDLLWYSDLAVSGGGTMNREAALLGVPTYSMFTGKRCAVDEELANKGLLTFLERPEDIAKVVWNQREIANNRIPESPRLLYEIADLIRSFL